MTTPQLVIAHLYPDEMNIYGDNGNVVTLVKRLQWRGLKARVDPVGIGQDYDWSTADIVFGGGGQDRGQQVVATDLQQRGSELRHAAGEGLVMLLVCGLYQLFGHSFQPLEDEIIDGIGVFNATTVATSDRLIGNVVISSTLGRLVGFENHSGQTTLLEDQEPLGRIIKGYGNDAGSAFEGAISGNSFGTYLHGPILPKNPLLTDQLIKLALARRYPDVLLKPLDDSLETTAAAVAASRPA